MELEEMVLFDLGGGRLVKGLGPWKRAKQAPEGGWAFYINDFGLSEDEPWLVPARLEFSCEGGVGQTGRLEVDWREPEIEGFADVFGDIEARVASGELRKAVPAVVARAAWSDGMAQEFLERLPRRASDAGTYAYAFCEGNQGFAGRTPEVLLSATLEDVIRLPLLS